MIINEQERGFLFKNGKFQKFLEPGKYFTPLTKNTEIKIVNINKRFFIKGFNINQFLENPEISKFLDVIEVADNEIALLYSDGVFSRILKSGKYAYWNILKKHNFQKISLNNSELPKDVDISIFSDENASKFVDTTIVESYETGLLFYNGVYQKNLQPGKYHHLKGNVTAKIEKVDMRQKQIDMNGQEIMTEDKITLRLNFVCQYKIVNPYKALVEIKDLEGQLYILLQLILREYVGSIKLDDLLLKKEEIGNFVLRQLSEKKDSFGVEFLSAGLKDVILPGEIKDILNKVLIAQKEAQANVIMRREETASTRSLINTAKLMEENAVLYKLKEMEYLEKICSKVGNINLGDNCSLKDQINKLIGNATQ